MPVSLKDWMGRLAQKVELTELLVCPL
jgi:hypothetical protein